MPNIKGVTGLRVTVHTPNGEPQTFFPVMGMSVNAESYMLTLTWEDNTGAPKLMQESFSSGQWLKVELEP